MTGDAPPPAVAYMAALRGLTPLFNSLDRFGLARGAWRAGFLRACAEPATALEVATGLGLDPTHVRRVLGALVAHGLLERHEERHVVSEAWRPLLLESPPMDLLDAWRYAEARSRMVEDAVAGGHDYWAAREEDRTAYAVGVAVDPESTHGVELIAAGQAANPVLTQLLENGGRYLELGCGTAGAMAATLQLHPHVSAVGVELSDDLVRIARGRAERLGLTDRMEVIHGDAADFDESDAFDFGFWSQFFFPEATRAGALATLLRSVRSGGAVMAPLMGDPVTSVEQLQTDDGREHAVDLVLHGSWGIPIRSPEELHAEFEAAGFVDAELVQLPFARVVLARRP